MKKISTLVLIIGFALSIFAQTATPPAVGDGTSGNPYQVATLDNLYFLSQNSSWWTNYYIQTANIDATQTSTWDSGMGFTPIGNSSSLFKGNYNGQGYTIENLTINRPSTEGIGLFGMIENATVSNVGVVNCSMTGDNNVGGLIGWSRIGSTVNNCFSTGNIVGNEKTGGLIGYIFMTTCADSYSLTDVSGSIRVGGLAGRGFTATFINCYCSGSVSVTSTSEVGGFLGRNAGSGTATNCFWDTETSGQTTSALGTGKTTAEMKTQSTYIGWDFANTWGIHADFNDGYPYLAWQPVPTVTTQAVSSIGTTTATGNGNITSLGIPDPTQHGVCWSTTTAPTISSSKTEEGATSSTDAFTSDIIGLTLGTMYYVRSYATNEAGTSYGNEVSFTSHITPTVTTQAVSDVTSTSAIGNGNITDFGVPNLTQHGVCWSLSTNPTTADSKTEEGAASTTGTFTSNITGLTEELTYYVRAYAINSVGTSYGNEVSFIAVSVPTTQASEIMLSDVQNTQMTIDWTAGNGAKRAVFAMQINPSKTPTAIPVDGTTYTANPVYGSGSQIATSGWYCIYNGTEATTTVTGLTPNANYRFMVCEYNGSPSNEYYNVDTSANNPFEVFSVPLSDWAIYIALLLMAGFIVFRSRKLIAV